MKAEKDEKRTTAKQDKRKNQVISVRCEILGEQKAVVKLLSALLLLALLSSALHWLKGRPEKSLTALGKHYQRFPSSRTSSPNKKNKTKTKLCFRITGTQEECEHCHSATQSVIIIRCGFLFANPLLRCSDSPFLNSYFATKKQHKHPETAMTEGTPQPPSEEKPNVQRKHHGYPELAWSIRPRFGI